MTVSSINQAIDPNINLTTSVKPFSVMINWSESRQFKNGELYDFMDFERKALEVAKANPLGGYDKTNVTVTFENDDEHQCRLDLGAGGNDIGFAEHCVSVMEYHQRNNEQELLANDPYHQQLITLIATYALDMAFVVEARNQVKQATESAKQQEHKQKQARIAQRQQARRDHQAQEEAFQQALCVPEWAKGVIVATYSVYDEDRSEPCISQYESKKLKTIILGWSTHTRRLFPELRNACLNHLDTVFLSDREQSKEHRNNYSMGDGTYLTDKDYRYYGWQVRKHTFWNEADKAKYVPLGEIAIPDVQLTEE